MDKIILKVSFKKSPSFNYEKIIKSCKKFDDFIQSIDKNVPNILTIKDKELFLKWGQISKIIETASAWKGTTILLNDKNTNWFYLRQALDSLIKCYIRFETGYDKANYCSEGVRGKEWGCRLLTRISCQLNEYYYQNDNSWYSYGHFEGDDVWKVDKDRIKEAIKNEVDEKYIFLCPIFSFKKIEKEIDKLPNEIKLEDNKHWEKVYEENVYGETKSPKQIGVKYVGSGGGSMSISLGGFLDEVKEEINNDRVRNIPEVKFEDIGGIDETIQSIREVIELPLKRPELLIHLGLKSHRGILLYGPPGNGKTLIAKAIANDVKAHFIPISGPELLNKFYGQSEENLREIFKEARDLKPSIIFFDEIDSIGAKRDEGESSKFANAFLNQLLTSMDGMDSNENIVVLASTNRPELLDSALLRPGRFDYKIYIGNPDELGCKKIFQIHTSSMPIEKDFDKGIFSKKLFGLSGAEIAFVCKEAGYNALRRSLDLKEVINSETLNENYKNITVIQKDFDTALEKVKSEKLLNNSGQS